MAKETDDETANKLSFVNVAGRQQTYLNLLYLVVAFPLSIVYFLILLAGLAVSLGTLIIWIGAPLLLLVHIIWWRFAAFERALAIDLLHVDIKPLALPSNVKMSRWERIQERLSNSATWKSLIYLFVKFPLSCCMFSAMIVLLLPTMLLCLAALALTLCLTPLIVLFSILIGRPISGKTIRRMFGLALLGFGSANVSLYLVNILAFLAGLFARGMLGMSTTHLRLAEARAQAEQERRKALQAERKRRELIVNISHELRTPVASISGHVESLLMSVEANKRNKADPVAPQELRPYLAIIYREAGRLSSLIDDLLGLARSDAGELHLQIVPVEASSIVREVELALSPIAYSSCQVTLVSDIEADLPLALADSERLAQVLLNLVRNAITYTPAGGIVSIHASRAEANRVELSVSDTGIGIPEDDLDLIFERFYRTDQSRARNTGGSGLGLAIVRDLIAAMGGSISVESKVGEGSCFHVYLQTAGAGPEVSV